MPADIESPFLLRIKLASTFSFGATRTWPACVPRHMSCSIGSCNGPPTGALRLEAASCRVVVHVAAKHCCSPFQEMNKGGDSRGPGTEGFRSKGFPAEGSRGPLCLKQRAPQRWPPAAESTPSQQAVVHLRDAIHGGWPLFTPRPDPCLKVSTRGRLGRMHDLNMY